MMYKKTHYMAFTHVLKIIKPTKPCPKFHSKIKKRTFITKRPNHMNNNINKTTFQSYIQTQAFNTNDLICFFPNVVHQSSLNKDRKTTQTP